MSRARPIKINGKTTWFDRNRNSDKASDEQLELLAVAESLELDDLLDEVLTQGEVVFRLRKALGELVIPHEVLERRAKWRAERQTQPKCRICSKEGDSTRHHFVNKWILKELSHYARNWCSRNLNCVPICIDCHRGLHSRDTGAKVSIVAYLTDAEKQFVDSALSTLAEERPKLLLLIARGSDSVYESRLVKDWVEGYFDV